MQDKFILSLALVLTVFCIYFAHRFLWASKMERHNAALFSKTAASICFFAVGFLMAISCENAGFARKIVLALVLGLAGDVFIALRFLYPEKHDAFFAAGAASFAVGHVIYIWALLGIQSRVFPEAIAVWIVAVVLSLVYLDRKKVDAGENQVPSKIYIALVAAMCAVACALTMKSFSWGALMFALGGACFVVSDNVLIAYNFGEKPEFKQNQIIHVTYYAAQLLIAWSIIFI